MTDYTLMTNEQLLVEIDRLFRSYMYYQAAEGNWSAEREERAATNREYYAAMAEADKRNLKYDN